MSDKEVRRLGTWDSRKPRQSPKEMKKLLEKSDDTLKKTRIGPEDQGLSDRRYPTNYNSKNMKFIRDHNASVKKIIQARESNYKSLKRLTRSANPIFPIKVKDKVSITKRSPQVRPNVTYRTLNKQRILEGGSPKGSITATARAGAGLGWLKKKYLNYSASHWRKSKTH